MTGLKIEQFICREDNFGVLIHDSSTGLTASIDAPDEQAIRDALQRRGWNLDFILTTHHHHDHVEANLALKRSLGAKIIGPADEQIPELDQPVRGGDSFAFGSFNVEVIATPGHTAGEISFYLPQAKIVFTGDCLFSLGCGRLFEGSPADMFASLQRLAALPVDTDVYCGHEYTEANARFALAVDGNNSLLKARAEEVSRLRAENLLTLPSTIGQELATNPFLRCNDAAIRQHLAMSDATDVEVFAQLRKLKDNF